MVGKGSRLFSREPLTQSGICRTYSEFRSLNAQNSAWLIECRFSSLLKNSTSIGESSPLSRQGSPAVARSNLSVQRVAPSTSSGFNENSERNKGFHLTIREKQAARDRRQKEAL